MYYNIINILQQLSFIAIMIYVHHVFVMNTGYERWSLLGEIPRFSSNKVNNKDIRHFFITDISILDISHIISNLTVTHYSNYHKYKNIPERIYFPWQRFVVHEVTITFFCEYSKKAIPFERSERLTKTV